MKQLRVFSRQKTRRVDMPLLRRAALCVVQELLGWEDCQIAVYLIEPSEMASLNQTHLHHEGSTDVITFDYGGRSGEIFISIDDAVGQGRQFRRPWQEELARYVAHGLLHLAGYDDLHAAKRRAMKRRENIFVKELSRRFDLRKLERRKNV